MPEIIRNRTIRPSSRKETSVNFRVHLNGITAAGTLVVNINHESKPFHKTFKLRAVRFLKEKVSVLK
jgi:hypothetical protein